MAGENPFDVQPDTSEWDQLPRGPSGRPMVTITKPPVDSMVSQGLSGFQNWLSSPPQIKSDTPPHNPYQEPSQAIGEGVRSLGSHYGQSLKDLVSPFTKDDEGRYVADQPLPPPTEKAPQVQKDIGSQWLPVAAEVLGTFGGPPGTGLGWSLLGKATASVPFIRRGAQVGANIAKSIKTPEGAIEWLRHHFGGNPRRDWGYGDKNDYVNTAKYYQEQSLQRGLTPRQVRDEDLDRLMRAMDSDSTRYPDPVVPPPAAVENPSISSLTHPKDEFEKEATLIQNLLSDGGKERRQEISKFYDQLQARGVSERDIPELLSSNILGTTPERIASTLYIAALSHPQISEQILEMLPPHLKGPVDEIIGRYGLSTGRHPFQEWKESKKATPQKAKDDFFDPVKDDWVETEWKPNQSDHDWLDSIFGDQYGEKAPLAPMPPPSPEEVRLGKTWDNFRRQTNLSKDQLSRSAIPTMEKYILPHYGNDPKKFLDHYFGGMFNPRSEISGIRSVYDRGNDGVYVTAGLLNPATLAPIRGSSIERRIDPVNKQAYHAYFSIPRDTQASGISKTLLRNQVELYRDMDLDFVKLTANIDVGGYAWARYGFLPSEAGWNDIASRANSLLTSEVRAKRMSPSIAGDISKITSMKDPKAMWLLADYPVPSPYLLDNNKPAKWSQVLLMNSNWSGKLNLKDPESLKRFNEYISNKK